MPAILNVMGKFIQSVLCLNHGKVKSNPNKQKNHVKNQAPTGNFQVLANTWFDGDDQLMSWAKLIKQRWDVLLIGGEF